MAAKYIILILLNLFLFSRSFIEAQNNKLILGKEEQFQSFSISEKCQGYIFPTWLRQHSQVDRRIWTKPNQWWPMEIEFATTQACEIKGVVAWHPYSNENLAKNVCHTFSLEAPAMAKKRLSGCIQLTKEFEQKLVYPNIIFYDNDVPIKKLELKSFPESFLKASDELFLIVTSENAFKKQEHLFWEFSFSAEESRQANFKRKIVWAKPAFFPDNVLALQDFSAIIFDDLSGEWPNWNNSQWKALQNYITSGGRIYVCAGFNDGYLNDVNWQKLLPVELKEIVVINKGNADFSSSFPCFQPPEIPITIFLDTPFQLRKSIIKPQASVYATLATFPWIVSQDYGCGKIIFLSTSFCDPYWKKIAEISEDKKKHLNGEDFLLQKIHDQNPVTDLKLMAGYLLKYFPKSSHLSANSLKNINDAHLLLDTVSGFVPPPFSWIIIILLTYIGILVSIVMICYLKKKYFLAWFLAIVWAMLFLMTFLYRGQNWWKFPIVANDISLIQAKIGSNEAYASHIFSITAQHTNTYNISVGNETYYVFPERVEKNNYNLLWKDTIEWMAQRPNKIQIRLYSNANEYFSAQGQIPFEENWESQLKLEQEKIIGKITNPTNILWKNAWIIIGDFAVPLGNITPGETKKIDSYLTIFSLNNLKKELLEMEKNSLDIFSSQITSINKQFKPYLITFSNIPTLNLSGIGKIAWSYTFTALILELHILEFSTPYPVKQKFSFYKPEVSYLLPQEKYQEVFFPILLDKDYYSQIQKITLDISFKDHNCSNVEIYNISQKKWLTLAVEHNWNSVYDNQFFVLDSSYICPYTNKFWLSEFPIFRHQSEPYKIISTIIFGKK